MMGIYCIYKRRLIIYTICKYNRSEYNWDYSNSLRSGYRNIQLFDHHFVTEFIIF